MAKIQWSTDEAHSQVQFKVRHMMVSNVVGEFNQFEAKVETEEDDFSTAKATFTAPVDSIETKNKQREEHLKSADFFDAEHHPNISFKSTEVKQLDDNHYEMIGELTMRSTTKPVTLQVEKGGIIKEANGKYRAGFEVTGKINRKNFGLKYNALTESGGLVVADEINIRISLELIQS